MLAEKLQPVKMILEVSEKGETTPTEFIWPDGRRFKCTVLAVTPAPIKLVGSMGQCYICQVRTKQVKVYETQGRWSVESKTTAVSWGDQNAN